MATPISSSGQTAADARALVVDGYNRAEEIGDELLEQTLAALENLTYVQVAPLTISVDYDVNSFLPSFVKPVRPGDPSLPGITAQQLDAPTLADVVMRDVGAAPVEPNMDAYSDYVPPAAPAVPMPVAPVGVTPVLDEIDAPDRPVYVLPDVPTLLELDLPDAPVITIPAFDAIRPTFQYDVPEDGDLAYVETEYSSELLDEMRSVIGSMMQGNYGLPLTVEQALFDRARAREDRLSRKQVMEVAEDMSARNLVEPNGILAGRLREVRAENREKGHALNRDLAIERAKEALEGVKSAITQGMALEQVLIQQNESRNERALKVAMYVRDFSINRLNAQIGIANLQSQMYATDAQVWRQRIEGELSKLEAFKAQIDAQRLRGEINSDLIDQYKAQFDAIRALSDIYRSDVEAAKAKGDLNLQKLEAAKLVLQKYSTEVEGWSKLWDGYKSQVDAAQGRVRFAEALAGMFATRMQAYKIKGDVYAQEAQMKLANNGQLLSVFQAKLANAAQDLQGQMAALDAAVKQHEARTRLYQAEGDIAQAESAALDRAVSLKNEQERNRTDVALRQADMGIQQMLKIGEIMVEQLKARAQALAQLLASSQSGVNLAASISGSGSASSAWGVNWSGEAPDYTGSTTFG